MNKIELYVPSMLCNHVIFKESYKQPVPRSVLLTHRKSSQNDLLYSASTFFPISLTGYVFATFLH